MKVCQIVAEAVTVLCPYCGQPQPNAQGSEMWTAEDFKHSGKRTCVSCEQPIMVVGSTKIQFDWRPSW